MNKLISFVRLYHYISAPSSKYVSYCLYCYIKKSRANIETNTTHGTAAGAIV